MPTDAENDLVRLEAEAGHASRRLALYRAKAYGLRPTDPAKLRTLEREAVAATDRLAYARDRAAEPPTQTRA